MKVTRREKGGGAMNKHFKSPLRRYLKVRWLPGKRLMNKLFKSPLRRWGYCNESDKKRKKGGGMKKHFKSPL